MESVQNPIKIADVLYGVPLTAFSFLKTNDMFDCGGGDFIHFALQF